MIRGAASVVAGGGGGGGGGCGVLAFNRMCRIWPWAPYSRKTGIRKSDLAF